MYNYMVQRIKRNMMMWLLPLIILAASTSVGQVKAWEGPGCCGGPGVNYWGGGGGWNQQWAGAGGFDNPYQNGWTHGIADAQYDHQNNLVYNAGPACDSCHTPLYLDGFRHGYNQQWNTYQNTEQNSQQTVNNYINVKNSPGAYILNDRQNNDQNSDQGQSNGPGPGMESTPYQDP